MYPKCRICRGPSEKRPCPCEFHVRSSADRDEIWDLWMEAAHEAAERGDDDATAERWERDDD